MAVVLLVLVGLFFVADVAIRQYLESRGASEVAETMAAEDANVDLGGIPFLPGFLSGRIDHVSVRVRGASGPGGLRVQLLEVRLAEVRFSPRRLFNLARSSFAKRTQVEALNPIGVLELGEDDLKQFIIRHVAAVEDVQVKSSGIEVFFPEPEALRPSPSPTPSPKPGTKAKPIQPVRHPARFLPRVENGRILLSLVGVAQIPAPFRSQAQTIEGLIRLPKIPNGLRTDVRLGDGVVVFESAGHDVKLDVGEGE
jgi:hypothetical protein